MHGWEAYFVKNGYQFHLLTWRQPNVPSGAVRDYVDLDCARRELPNLLSQSGGTARVWRWANPALWLDVFGNQRSLSLTSGTT